MDILNPPRSYIDFKCALHGVPDDEVPDKARIFFKNKDHSNQRAEIRRFLNWLHNARHERTLPIEKMEVREADGKKHSRVVRMMIYDIDYFMDEDQIKRRKIYMPLEKDYETPAWGPDYSFFNQGHRPHGRGNDKSVSNA